MFNFNTFTAEFNTLHSSFRIHIIGKRLNTCLLAFELNFLFDLVRSCTFSTQQTNFSTLLLFISFDT